MKGLKPWIFIGLLVGAMVTTIGLYTTSSGVMQHDRLYHRMRWAEFAEAEARQAEADVRKLEAEIRLKELKGEER